jgi:hypothetical protein
MGCSTSVNVISERDVKDELKLYEANNEALLIQLLTEVNRRGEIYKCSKNQTSVNLSGYSVADLQDVLKDEHIWLFSSMDKNFSQKKDIGILKKGGMYYVTGHFDKYHPDLFHGELTAEVLDALNDCIKLCKDDCKGECGNVGDAILDFPNATFECKRCLWYYSSPIVKENKLFYMCTCK